MASAELVAHSYRRNMDCSIG